MEGGFANSVGGICGWSWNNAVAVGCYNTGDISLFSQFETISEAGGICGANYAYLGTCYSTGDITAAGGVMNSTGGVVGNNSSVIVASYWLKRGYLTAGIGSGGANQEINVAAFGASSWPGVGEVPGGGSWADKDWIVGDSSRGWKSFGAWSAGGNPDGINSLFPKLWWE
jgi:hypothetical protein